jgi:deoxyribonuclease V
VRVRRLRFDVTPREGVAIQRRLAARLAARRAPPLRLRRGDLVAGADAAYDEASGLAFGTVVVCRVPEMDVVERVSQAREVTFPYVPGLLSFREAPVLLDCFRAVRSPVRAVLIDGAGAAHPRGFGLACHVGYALGLPTAGCAKSLLFGEHGPVPEARGASTPILDGRRRIGEVVRTRERVRPVYVSVGWDITQRASVRLVLDCVTRYRLPEPTRLADLEVERFKRRAAFRRA